jgi:hypothetical protein
VRDAQVRLAPSVASSVASQETVQAIEDREPDKEETRDRAIDPEKEETEQAIEDTEPANTSNESVSSDKLANEATEDDVNDPLVNY